MNRRPARLLLRGWGGPSRAQRSEALLEANVAAELHGGMARLHGQPAEFGDLFRRQRRRLACVARRARRADQPSALQELAGGCGITQ